MKNAGFTLLELIIVTAILTMVIGVLLVLANTLGQASRVQEAKVRAHDEARTGMMLMTKELRQAARSSINWGSVPADTITYQIALDLDGNGYAVDVNGDLELSAPRTISRDTMDLNSDGQTITQLILNDGVQVRVLANGLSPNEDANDNGVLDSGEDLNFNGRLERGVWFQALGQGVQVTLDAERPSSPQGGVMMSGLIQIVTPRN